MEFKFSERALAFEAEVRQLLDAESGPEQRAALATEGDWYYAAHALDFERISISPPRVSALSSTRWWNGRARPVRAPTRR